MAVERWSGANHPRMSRRRLLSGATMGVGALVGGGLLAGCSADSPDAPGESQQNPSGGGTLRVGHYGWVGNVLSWLPDLKSKFEEENPGITIELIPVPSGEDNTESLVQKLSLEARQGEGSYDLLLGPTPWIEVGALVKAGALMPIDDLAKGEWMDKLVEPSRNEVTGLDGKMYGLPFVADVVGFMDRVDLQAEYGVEPPQSWDDLLAMATSNDLPTEVFPFASDWTSIHRFFLPMLATYADPATIFADNGAVDMSTPEVLKCLENLKALVGDMPANTNQPGKHLDAFHAGAALSQSYWQSGVRSAVRQGLTEDQVTYRPNLTGDREGTFFWSTSAVIPTSSALPELAAKFFTEGVVGDWGLQKIVEESGTVSPVDGLDQITELPPQVQTAYEQLDTALTLPANDAWLTIEGPEFKREVERMMAEDLEPKETQATLSELFSAYEG